MIHWARRFSVGGAVVVIATWTLSGWSAGDSGSPPEEVETFARSGGTERPITVGSIVAQGRRNGGSCSFDEPFEVGARVRGNSDHARGPTIRVSINAACQAVIAAIVPAQEGGAEPPQDGHSVEPEPRASTEGGDGS